MHPSPTKKTKADTTFLPNKIATAENAAKADQNQPIFKLLEEVKRTVKNPPKGDAVVYWMRMEDMRISDNTALSQASELAVKSGVPLLVLFVLSPQDYKAHDRGARRIDFTLRNLRVIQDSLAQLNIPLYTLTHTPRKTLPERVLSIMTQWKVKNVFANIEYEVDELRRDIRVSELARNGGIQCTFLHDKCVIAPGLVQTKEGRGYSVYSPFLRAWLPHLRDTPDPLSCLPSPVANHTSARCHDVYGSLFNHEIPDAIEGLELRDGDAEQMRKCWPAGENSAKEMLLRFLYTKSRGSQLGQVDPLADGAKAPDKNPKDSRVGKYKDARDRLDADTTSRLSPYLAAGVISARECIRATVALSGGKVDASRDTGIGRWVQEVVWRDFYTMCWLIFPVSPWGALSRRKFANVNWETNEKHLQAWKDGRTGVPIVDAGMRQANTMGWMHNRVRMITAMYLVKDLMIDWRLGEQYFMETLIDGDLASNNGGWQWSASTGVDAAPYFRIFNPYTQSQKADPTGEYIRHFVPELSNVRGDGEMFTILPVIWADKLKYPRPFVKHSEARERAIRRYKVPGQE